MDEIVTGSGTELLMATVDNWNSRTGCTLIFDGSDTVSTKRYKYLSNASPINGSRVLVARIYGDYLIIGRIYP